MSIKKNKFEDCGIIVGRFQVHKLTEAHFKLIQMVLERHAKVIIFLGISGISPVPSTKRNPLDFELRKQMLEKAFEGNNLIVSYVKDMKCDEIWSKQLDMTIKRQLNRIRNGKFKKELSNTRLALRTVKSFLNTKISKQIRATEKNLKKKLNKPKIISN